LTYRALRFDGEVYVLRILDGRVAAGAVLVLSEPIEMWLTLSVEVDRVLPAGVKPEARGEEER
jgi:hypothetical protein